MVLTPGSLVRGLCVTGECLTGEVIHVGAFRGRGPGGKVPSMAPTWLTASRGLESGLDWARKSKFQKLPKVTQTLDPILDPNSVSAQVGRLRPQKGRDCLSSLSKAVARGGYLVPGGAESCGGGVTAEFS